MLESLSLPLSLFSLSVFYEVNSKRATKGVRGRREGERGERGGKAPYRKCSSQKRNAKEKWVQTAKGDRRGKKGGGEKGREGIGAGMPLRGVVHPKRETHRENGHKQTNKQTD